MTAEEALELAAQWERQSRWLSTRQQDAAVRFAGVHPPKSTDEATRLRMTTDPTLGRLPSEAATRQRWRRAAPPPPF